MSIFGTSSRRSLVTPMRRRHSPPLPRPARRPDRPLRARASQTSGPAPTGGSAKTATAPAAAQAQVDVAAVLTELASKNKEKLEWRNSIVDIMKLLDLDSSLSARKELAKELNYTGDTNNSARMNIWLHKQVMVKLAENGGKGLHSLKV